MMRVYLLDRNGFLPLLVFSTRKSAVRWASTRFPFVPKWKSIGSTVDKRTIWTPIGGVEERATITSIVVDGEWIRLHKQNLRGVS